MIKKFSKRNKWLIALLILLLIIGGLTSVLPRVRRPPGSFNSVQELEAYLEKVTENGIPPGMSLAVVKSDSIVYSKGFGWADQPRNIRATPQTVYHWYSITKIMQLYPEEKLGFILFANNIYCKGGKIVRMAAGLEW